MSVHSEPVFTLLGSTDHFIPKNTEGWEKTKKHHACQLAQHKKNCSTAENDEDVINA